jgi:hypothetical protein
LTHAFLQTNDRRVGDPPDGDDRGQYGQQPVTPQPRATGRALAALPSSQQAQACELRLDANEGALGGDLECVAQLIGLRPGSWLVTPDTLALVGGDGSNVVHFSREGALRYGWTAPDGTPLILERQQP